MRREGDVPEEDGAVVLHHCTDTLSKMLVVVRLLSHAGTGELTQPQRNLWGCGCLWCPYTPFSPPSRQGPPLLHRLQGALPHTLVSFPAPTALSLSTEVTRPVRGRPWATTLTERSVGKRGCHEQRPGYGHFHCRGLLCPCPYRPCAVHRSTKRQWLPARRTARAVYACPLAAPSP